MKEDLIVLNRNIEREDIDSIGLAIKKLSVSSENQFSELKNERWFNRLFNMITFSNKKNIRLAEQITTLAQAQEILVRILLFLSEKSSKISELVKNNTKDIEKLGENDIYLLNRIKKLEDKVFGIKREIRLENLSLQAKEILSACLKELSILFNYTNDNQKLYVNFILNQLNIDRVEYNNLKLAIDELDSNNEKTQILISCLEYIYLKNNNFNILKTNYQILNFIEMFYFSKKKIDEIKNQVERDSNFDGIIFRYGNDYNEDFEDDNFLLDFIDSIEEIEIEKKDLYIDSMFNIKEGEIYVIENKNIHISSMINCSGTLEIKNCTLYYNEILNNEAKKIFNKINLGNNSTLKVENSTVICKNYDKNFFIKGEDLKKSNIYLKNTIFIDCLNCINSYVIDASVENCEFRNCVRNFFKINVYGDFLMKDCSIIQEKLPDFKIPIKEYAHNNEVLFYISNSSKKSTIFTSNKVDIYFYDNERQYNQLIGSNYPNKNLIVKNSIFNNHLENKFSLKITAEYIDNCSFYSLKNILKTESVNNCFFENCSFICQERNSNLLYVKNTEFRNCNDSLFPSNKDYINEYSLRPSYYHNKIIFENCKFSGNNLIKGNFIELGCGSQIKNCEFSNISIENFLISISIDEKSLILIQNTLFKNCTTERNDKEIIKKYGLMQRVIKGELIYKMAEVKDCQFV
ncbi:hypothetical protein RN96_07215 [Fusobacterium polymorphum]|uniref:Uncharacterized protein n=1 Tax=Fusobacterium nucleatum subsp. polymorphum TaxID=76857 RepID=A0A2B7Y9X7_FUSNP|nr:hypothetical protein [Fusobacterium polymorphum]PGH20874.1 hypothetical protein RN96_07215 [Fusobacterium polymorphum]